MRGDVQKRKIVEEDTMVCKMLWLFIIYSFMGWVAETIAAAFKQKRFANRGMINGPFCVIYGFSALAITFSVSELEGVWLFVGSLIVATVVEWVAGHLIERWYHERWWDYRNFKWNLDGYISAPTSCVWGLAGFATIRWGNPLFIRVYEAVPSLVGRFIVLIISGGIAIDALASMIVLAGRSKNIHKWQETDDRIDSVTRKLNGKIYNFVDRRIRKAYPQEKPVEAAERNPAIFAYGCSFYKIVMLFFIGAFLGDITETIFCRLTAGVWMSRSSVVWGPFSIVWGLAIACVTALLYRYRSRSDSFLFWMGTFLGGAYEYICSVFTELVFGTVFWDYSQMPFNLGGRINLLYCFFWGIAAVVWFKVFYPRVSSAIEKLPVGVGRILTWVLLAFMAVNVVVSSAALVRYGERSEGIAAETEFGTWIDGRFDDARMERIYPNALKVQ